MGHGSLPTDDPEDDSADTSPGQLLLLHGHMPSVGDGLPPHVTLSLAKEQLAVLQSFAANWLPVLFNAHVAAPPHLTSQPAAAIAAYAAVAPADVLAGLFKTILKKLIAVRVRRTLYGAACCSSVLHVEVVYHDPSASRWLVVGKRNMFLKWCLLRLFVHGHVCACTECRLNAD